MTQTFVLTFTNHNRHEDHDAASCIWHVHRANKHDNIRFKGQHQSKVNTRLMKSLNSALLVVGRMDGITVITPFCHLGERMVAEVVGDAGVEAGVGVGVVIGVGRNCNR